MRKFGLYRDEDPTGISGTGRVADGVEFTSGKCVLHWLTDVSSVGVYDSMAQVVKIHGHNGLTRVVWDEATTRMFTTLEECFVWLADLPDRWSGSVLTSPVLARRRSSVFTLIVTDSLTGQYVTQVEGDNLLALFNEVGPKLLEKYPAEFAQRG